MLIQPASTLLNVCAVDRRREQMARLRTGRRWRLPGGAAAPAASTWPRRRRPSARSCRSACTCHLCLQYVSSVCSCPESGSGQQTAEPALSVQQVAECASAACLTSGPDLACAADSLSSKFLLSLQRAGVQRGHGAHAANRQGDLQQAAQGGLPGGAVHPAASYLMQHSSCKTKHLIYCTLCLSLPGRLQVTQADPHL
jgi:hypothetical protein